MNKKVLITGASGFVGSYLVEESLSRGLEVYAGVRSTSSKEYLQNSKIRFCEINLSSKEQLIKLLDDHKFDFVLHNAGLTKASSLRDYVKVNAEFTKNIAEASVECKNPVSKFILTSSLASFGPADFSDHEIIDDRMNNHPVTWYGESKLAAEQVCFDIPSLPYLIFRPTAVFGPRDHEFLPIFQTVKKRIAPQIGLSTQNLSFIYVKDLARMMIDALLSKHERKGYFVSDGIDYSSDEFNRIIAKSLNIKAIKLPIPITILKFAGYLSEGISKLTKKYPMLNTQKVNELKARNWRCDISGLKNDFDFAPKYSLEEALIETKNWYERKGLL